MAYWTPTNKDELPMKLYTCDPAPNARRLALFMQYKGIEIDTKQVDLMGNEQLSDDYLAVNPAATIPALILDDGTVLTEVIGMCAYLENSFPDKPLLGSTPLEKAQILSWDHKLYMMIIMAVAEALRNRGDTYANRALPGPLDVPQIPELVERGQLRLSWAWPTLDAEIAGREWLVGDSMTLADIDLLVCADFSGWVKARPPEECANIHAHRARVKQALSLD